MFFLTLICSFVGPFFLFFLSLLTLISYVIHGAKAILFSLHQKVKVIYKG